VGAIVFPDGVAYGGDAQIGAWLSAMNHFVRVPPRGVIPLHGAIIGEDELRRERDALAWLRGQVEYGLGLRLAWEEIRSRVLKDDGLAARFAVDSPFLPGLLDRMIAQGAATRDKLLQPAPQLSPEKPR
jgi:hypothetical protein